MCTHAHTCIWFHVCIHIYITVYVTAFPARSPTQTGLTPSFVCFCCVLRRSRLSYSKTSCAENTTTRPWSVHRILVVVLSVCMRVCVCVCVWCVYVVRVSMYLLGVRECACGYVCVN